MKILLTGGLGFIGSYITELYWSQGHEVVIIDNMHMGINKIKSFFNESDVSLKVYKEDLGNYKKIKKIIQEEKPDIINHHASNYKLFKNRYNPIEMFKDLRNMINLLEICREYGIDKIKKFIFASSGDHLYGNQKHYPVWGGKTPKPRMLYGIIKMQCEQYLNFYNEQYGLPWTSLRYTYVYGPHKYCKKIQKKGSFCKICDMLYKSNVDYVGNGKETRDYVWVGDAAQASLVALHDDVHGSYNIGTGIETSFNGLVKIIEDTKNKKCRVNKKLSKMNLIRGTADSLFFRKKQWFPVVNLDIGIKTLLKLCEKGCENI